MGRFTKIPETNLAGALGSIVGKSAGITVSNVELAISKLQSKLDTLCTEFPKDKQAARKNLEQIETTINTIQETVSKVEGTVQGLKSVASTVEVPIAAAKVALNVVKYLPLPQMWLVTSVSALQADLIQMLSELIAQIEQIVLTLLTVVTLILKLLKQLTDSLEKIHRVVVTLKSRLALQEDDISEQDRKVLENLGILDQDGGSVFDQLSSILNGDLTDIFWVGNYKSIDTGSLAVINLVKAAESGTTVDVPIGTVGNWITTVYMISDEKPEKPVGSSISPNGWSSTVSYEKDRTWASKGTVSGLTGKAISWTDPAKCSEVKEVQDQITPKTEKVHVFRLNQTKLEIAKLNLEEANAIVFTKSDEAYELIMSFLRQMDEAPLSQDLKEQLTIEINPQEDQSESNSTEDWYVSRSGNQYLMKIKTSSVSPKIATLRYVEVTDEAGSIVYEGSQTFATDSNVLFEETRTRLIQLLG